MAADDLLAPLTAAWAKEGRTGVPHPAICHLIDTAAVAELLYPVLLGPRVRAELERGLAPLGQPRAWAAVLCGLHDLGKVSPIFQAQCYEIAVERMGQGAVAALDLAHRAVHQKPRRDLKHERITAVHLHRRLREQGAPEAADAVAAVLGAHHGWVPDPLTLRSSEAMRAHVGDASWWRLRDATVDRVAELWGLPPLADVPWREVRLSLPAVIGLSGLTTISDWIASDRKRFPWRPDVTDLDEYHRDAREIARAVVDGFGWVPWRPAGSGFGELFTDGPGPMQHAVAEFVAPRTRPGVLVIEAPTGEGKTKAGLQAAASLVRALGLSGMYAALPTRATIKACYDEVNELLAHTGSPLRAVPAHGDGFQQVREERSRPEPLDLGIDHNEDGAHRLRAQAREWFSQKRGLLAPIGVGTVDQALRGMVRSKHTFMRLTSLSGKVLLVDEVHSYDTYTSRILERLLWWCGRLEIPVILMSATLTAQRRERLLAEWQSGARAEPVAVPQPVSSSGTDWRLTWSDAEERAEPVSGATRQETRTVEITKLKPGGECSWVLDELGSHGSAMIVHSTKAQVADTTARLRKLTADTGAEILALTGSDKQRADKERALHERLGRNGTFSGRLLVVGTSMLENMDLDVDVLVTDLCPIDLLIQRLGRLHRREPRGTPRVGITGLTDLPDSGEIPVPERAVQVYSKYVLQATALVLKERSAIELPGDVPKLVRAVYEQGPATEALPKYLRSQEYAAHQGEVLCVPRSDDHDTLYDLTERPGSPNRTRRRTGPPEQR